MTVKGLITELEAKVSALKRGIEEDMYNGDSSLAKVKFAYLYSFEYCLDRLKEIKDN